jgi:hypothetical protein
MALRAAIKLSIIASRHGNDKREIRLGKIAMEF